jgi:hypothetical protein
MVRRRHGRSLSLVASGMHEPSVHAIVSAFKPLSCMRTVCSTGECSGNGCIHELAKPLVLRVRGGVPVSMLMM